MGERDWKSHGSRLPCSLCENIPVSLLHVGRWLQGAHTEGQGGGPGAEGQQARRRARPRARVHVWLALLASPPSWDLLIVEPALSFLSSANAR